MWHRTWTGLRSAPSQLDLMQSNRQPIKTHLAPERSGLPVSFSQRQPLWFVSDREGDISIKWHQLVGKKCREIGLNEVWKVESRKPGMIIRKRDLLS